MQRKEREENNMALGILLIMFIAVSAISVLGLALLLLVKNEAVKKGIFYALSVWGMLLAVYAASSLPTNYVLQRVETFGIALLSVIGLLIHLGAKANAMRYAAYGLVAVSMFLGIMKLFVL